MSDIAKRTTSVTAMGDDTLELVRALRDEIGQLPQTTVETHHLIHGGLYSRTVFVPAGNILAGVTIRVATMLTICGDVSICQDGGELLRVTGYQVIPASANRCAAMLTHADTHITMTMTTAACTVAEAESEFSHEADLLMSRADGAINHITITGE